MKNIINLPSAKGWVRSTVANEAAYALLKHGSAESRFLTVPEVAEVWNATAKKTRMEFARTAVENIRTLLEEGAGLTANEHAVLEDIADPVVRSKTKAAMMRDKRRAADASLAAAMKQAAARTLETQVATAVPAADASEQHIKRKQYKLLQNIEASLCKYKAKTAPWMTESMEQLDDALNTIRNEKETFQ